MKDIKESSIYMTKLYPKVEQNLKVKSMALLREISKFIDYRSEVLTATGPSKRLLFSDVERERMCSHMGLTLREIDKCIDEYTDGERYRTIDKPFNVACVLAIRYFQLNKKIKEQRVMSYILGMTLYSGLHVKYFEFLPNENIMNYTINNLSNKFKIKQLGSLGKALEYTCSTTHETYTDLITNGTDGDVRKYIMNMNTRVNGFLQNIAVEFYENHKKGNYLNTEEDNYDEENYYQTDNNSMAISRIADSVTLKIVAKGIDHTVAEVWAKETQISVSAVKNAIIEITSSKDEQIKELITCILQVYLSQGKNNPRTIKSRYFIGSCNAMYLKSNTNDPSIIRIKELLDTWLLECSANYNKTERAATKNNFRRAVFLYFAHSIMKCYEG